MANYSDIKGTTIQSVATDPTNAPDGQVWYNTATLQLKMEGGNYGSAPFTFAEAADLPAFKSTAAGGGTKSAAWITGGGGSPPAGAPATFLYNGASWTTSGPLSRPSQSNGMGSAGTSTAGVVWAGTNPYSNATEKFDGSSWSSSGAFPIAGSYGNGAGTQGAALSISLYQGSPFGICNEFNGSSWSGGGTLPNNNYSVGGCGTQTAGVAVGGEPAPNPAGGTQHQQYNGSSWTASTVLPSTRIFYGNGVVGKQDDTLVMGGTSPSPTTPTSTEYWNGSSWAAQGTLPIGKYGTASGNNAPSGSSAILMGGGPSTPVDSRVKVIEGIPGPGTPSTRSLSSAT